MVKYAKIIMLNKFVLLQNLPSILVKRDFILLNTFTPNVSVAQTVYIFSHIFFCKFYGESTIMANVYNTVDSIMQ